MPPSANALLEGIRDLQPVVLFPPGHLTGLPPPLMSLKVKPTLSFIQSLPRLMDLVLSVPRAGRPKRPKRLVLASVAVQTHPVPLPRTTADASTGSDVPLPRLIDAATDPVSFPAQVECVTPPVPLAHASSVEACSPPAPSPPPQPPGPNIRSYWTGDRPVLASDFTDWSCVHCGVVCADDNQFLLHLETPYHQAEIERQKRWFFACVVCDKLCDGIGSYHAHISGRKHLNKEKTFKLGNKNISALSITYKSYS